MSSWWQRTARQQGGEDYAAVYADRFRTMAADGGDVHEEADFVTELTAGPGTLVGSHL